MLERVGSLLLNSKKPETQGNVALVLKPNENMSSSLSAVIRQDFNIGQQVFIY